MAIQPQQAQQMIDKVTQVFAKVDLPTLQTFYGMAVKVLRDPKLYPQMFQQVMASGKVPKGEIPPQYDEKFMKSIVVALQIAIAQKTGAQKRAGGAQQGQPAQKPLNVPSSL
jgi:hypothetical protein